MSFPNWNSDASFNKITSSYFKDLIDLSGNLIIRNGTIKSPANTIEFDDTFSFINIPNSLNVLTQLKANYDSVEYDVGLQCEKVDTLVTDLGVISPIVYDTAFKCTNFYYDQASNSTVWSGLLTCPISSIASTAIANSTRFIEGTGNQNVGGIKRFTSNIRIDAAMVVSNNTVTITNAQLALIPNIGTLNTKLTDLTYSSGTTTTNISNNTTLANVSFTGNINTFTKAQFDNAINRTNSLSVNCQDTLTSLQSQITAINGVSLSASNVFTSLNQFTNIRLDNSLIVNNNGTILTNDNLNRIQYLSGVSSSVSTSLSNLNTSVSTLNTKCTKISYMSVLGLNTTTISDGLISQTFSFTGTINNISTTKFNWGLLNLTSDVQNQINDVNLDLGETNTRVASVENKTQKQSYNSSTLTTSFSNNLEFTSTLNNISTVVFGYLSGASENLQSAINSLKTRMTTAETALNPTGTIIQSVNGNIATNGYEPNYLLCDGRDVSRATYPALFNTIGIQYGWNNNATQFRLPDFRGVFLRGMGSVTRNNGVTYSSATNAYDFQADAIQDHTHSGQSGQYLGTNVSPQNNGYTFVSGNAPNSYSFASTGGMNTGRTATNTYPANFGIYYYIKT